MNFTGRYAIPAPAEAVWAALNDPEVLKYCIPGCEEIEKTSPTEFIATATLKIGTVLTYAARATVGGKLAQIGQRLIDGAARQIADDFFGRFSQAIAAASPAPELLADPEVEPAPPPAVQRSANREGMGPEIWMVGLVGVVVILLLIFGAVL